MPLNDIYKITDYQRLPSGEPVENVYFYQRLGAAGTAGDLEAVFVSTFLPTILGIQSQALVHNLIRFDNLGDPADFEEHSAGGIIGTLTAAIRNEWDCWRFTLRPSSKTVRPGSKRIAGVAESDSAYTNGVVGDAGILTLLQTARVQMSALLEGALETYQPVIIKRVLDGTTYRLPETNGELVAVPVSVALLNPKIGHQVSRGNAR